MYDSKVCIYAGQEFNDRIDGSMRFFVGKRQ